MAARVPQILFIDAYDSFSNNIIALVTKITGAMVTTIKIDDKRYTGNNESDFIVLLHQFDAVIAGPGPGSPLVAADVGLIDRLWGLKDINLLPVLGICLGFQSLARACGAKIEKLRTPEHGIVAPICHNQDSIFNGVGEINATQYNSLHAVLNDTSVPQVSHSGAIRYTQQDQPNAKLRQLAWNFASIKNGAVLMGIEHLNKPFWGIQYHPESICTNEEGAKVVQNWWTTACEWNLQHGRTAKLQNAARSNAWSKPLAGLNVQAIQNIGEKHEEFFPQKICSSRRVNWKSLPVGIVETADVCETLQLHHCETILLESGSREQGKPLNPETGRFSIICCIVPGRTERFEYYISSRQMVRSCEKEQISVRLTDQPWNYLNAFMRSQKREKGPTDSPFWGGLVGFVSYEVGLDSIGIGAGSSIGNRPDLSFAFVERSIVIDHMSKVAYVQSICEDDDNWIKMVETKLSRSLYRRCIGNLARMVSILLRPVASFLPSMAPFAQITVPIPFGESTSHASAKVCYVSPTRFSYTSKIRQCLSSIHEGDSYELCLTAQTTVHIPSTLAKTTHKPWLLYRRLRLQNPAPFSAYLRLGCSSWSETRNGVTILSSSPERFLCWSRSNPTKSKTPAEPKVEQETTIIQFRPIKGTVSKIQAPTRAIAEAMLRSPKETAENLMIVDLIRHDMNGVLTAASDQVKVAKLMVVEEYATVWQLVSVIEGEMMTPLNPVLKLESARCSSISHPHCSSVNSDTSDCCDRTEAPSGISVLAASLPPGSMTGAPKKRSCEILQRMEEQRPRGVYSGVLGYLDVGGGGDFSVVIRTAWRWDDDIEEAKIHGRMDMEKEAVENTVWSIGAGGAITMQSDPEAEYNEMRAKREPLIGIFDCCS